MTTTIVLPTGFGIFLGCEECLWQEEFFDKVGHGGAYGQID
jgi:hypothetical protein